MSLLLVVDDKEKPLRQTWPKLRAYAPARVTSWQEFDARLHKARGRTKMRPSADIVILNLDAPDAPTVTEAVRLRESQPELRFLYVKDITKERTTGRRNSEALTALSDPDVNWVSSQASDQEMLLRLQALVSGARPAGLFDVFNSGAASSGKSLAAFQALMPELHNTQSGRLDAVQIAQWFDMPLKSLAGLLGREYATVHKTPDAAALQDNLKVFLRLASALSRLAGSHRAARVWLNAPNAELEGNQTPLAAIENGEQEMVAEFLEDALFGQPG